MRIVSLLLGAITVMAGMTDASAMSSYKWQKRPLLVFAEDEGSTPLAAQRRILANSRAELNDRDVVVIWVIGGKATAELGPALKMSAAQLRSRYSVAENEFQVILVGKDGGTKLSSAKPLTRDKLFATIDAMPMRREEVRMR